MKRSVRYLLISFTLVAVLLVGGLGGVVIDRQIMSTTAEATNAPDLHLLTEAWSTIQRVYVDRSALQAQQLTYGAISGMVQALGDTGHSTFLTPEMLKQEHSATQGEFEGVGIEVEMKDGHLTIVAPLDNSPAQRAGLRAGEIIVKVNGKDISGLPLDQVIPQILGPAGTQVTLSIYNPSSGETRDVTLTRAHITLHNVTWQQVPGTLIAHLRITSFSQGVSQDLQTALAQIQQQGLSGIVLDLRNNPGGLLDEAVGVASQFLPKGNVLLERDAQGHTTPVPIDSKYTATNLPMVVLINQGTASAAEIVAGALQDAQRATLIGNTTFGTGTVLNEFPLSDGSALLLAVQEWLTPNGRAIWHQGIVPDRPVDLAANATALFPEAEKDLSAEQLQASSDQQLLTALDVLAHLPPPITYWINLGARLILSYS